MQLRASSAFTWARKEQKERYIKIMRRNLASRSDRVSHLWVCRATVLDGVAGGGARGELLKKDLACLVCGCAAGDPSYVAARRRTPWSESVRGEGATKAATVTLTRRNYKQTKLRISTRAVSTFRTLQMIARGETENVGGDETAMHSQSAVRAHWLSLTHKSQSAECVAWCALRSRNAGRHN
jgi:hypothetical protein